MGKRRYLTKAVRLSAYAAARYLNTDAEEELGVRIPFDVYLQDPLVADKDPKGGFTKLMVGWEPGLTDGPTSSRFVIVDYNGDTGLVAPMAKWDEKEEAFLDVSGKAVGRGNRGSLQFDQVNVWAVLQRALEFFEGSSGLGRPIDFGFEGNRLIVLPHAGEGRNAFYDRHSKSLQFYYFEDDDGKEVKTCLSADIINHEFGHAVLDGIRPHLFESPFVETAAFHEFIGDLAAILIMVRNNDFRRNLVKATGADLSQDTALSAIAEEFGSAIRGRPYLRSARNEKTMSDVADVQEPHSISEVLTGAMFDILDDLSRHYQQVRGRTGEQAFWDAAQRIHRTALQPLDLLPPVDVTFKDYAKAVLRADELANSPDPYGHRALMLKAFQKRGILSRKDVRELKQPSYLYDRLRLDVFHHVDDISRSRAAAYRFLDDNRGALFIPASQDVIVADLYDALKSRRQGTRLPRQVVLVYLWREEVLLEGRQFEPFDGEVTEMLCGGTLVFDQDGNVLSWARKPGTQRGKGRRWDEEVQEGRSRRDAFLKELAKRIVNGHVGAALGSDRGLLLAQVPPLTVRRDGGALRFQLSPHLHLSDDDHQPYDGRRKWEVSS